MKKHSDYIKYLIQQRINFDELIYGNIFCEITFDRTTGLLKNINFDTKENKIMVK